MELYDNLKDLTILIKDEVLNKYTKGELEPSLLDYRGIETSITDDGGFHFDYKKISVIYWGKAYSIVLRSLEKNQKFIEIRDFFYKCFDNNFNPSKNSKNVFMFPIPEEIIERFVFAYLNNPHVTDSEIEDLIAILIKESEGKPLKYKIKAEIRGIHLDIDEIKINDSCLLRKPKKEDLIRFFHTDVMYNVSQGIKPATPTTILEMEFKNTMDISNFNLMNAISILRLYKVGNVKCTDSKTFSKSFNFQSSDLTSKIVCESDEDVGHEIWYNLHNDDIEKIREFWDIMVDILPNILSKGYLSIAFDRYNSALKKTKRGIFKNGSQERKITEAVMGLEILFLKDEEGKVAKKFRRRIGKFMNTIGYKNLPHEDLAEIAYEIRSEYLHWGKVKEETENKLKSLYTLDKFLEIILDYLRVSIVVLTIIDNDRDEILDLIINSLNNDRTSEKELINILSEAKEII